MDGLKSLKKDIEDLFFSYEDDELLSELYDLLKAVENPYLKDTLLDILEDTQSEDSIDYEMLSTMLIGEVDSFVRMNYSEQ